MQGTTGLIKCYTLDASTDIKLSGYTSLKDTLDGIYSTLGSKANKGVYNFGGTCKVGSQFGSCSDSITIQ